MKVIIAHSIEMDHSEQKVVLESAKEIKGSISGLEFISGINHMLTTAFELGVKEGLKR